MKIGRYIISSHGFKIRKLSKVIDCKECTVWNIFGIGIIRNNGR